MPLKTKSPPVSAVLEKELCSAVSGVLPKEDALKKITAKLMDSCVETLETAIKDYREVFVTKATSILQGEAEVEPMLLPEGTRFYRKTAGAAVFVIEYKPTVRTLNFDLSDEVNPHRSDWKANYRLALPYLVFVPMFKFFDDGKPFFSAMCVAYRNAPLKSLRDMLYHPNLPNLGRPQHTDPWEPDAKEGDVTDFKEMIMCQGLNSKNQNFGVKDGKIPDMIDKVMGHFWASRYTGELSGMWKKMQCRDAEHYGSLTAWEQSSQDDPLFVLKSPWVPAIRLDKLLRLSLEYHDEGSSELSNFAGKYVGKIHDETWVKLLTKSRGGQKELAEAFGKRLEEILMKFASEIAKGMMVINNDTIRKTVQFAVAQALRESIK